MQLACTSQLSETVENHKISPTQVQDIPKLYPFEFVEGEGGLELRNRYTKVCTSRVEARWHQLIRANLEGLVLGSVRFRFFVDKQGTLKDLEVLHGDQTRLEELTRQAVLETQFPPIPTEMLSTLNEDRLKIEYEAILY